MRQSVKAAANPSGSLLTQQGRAEGHHRQQLHASAAGPSEQLNAQAGPHEQRHASAGPAEQRYWELMGLVMDQFDGFCQVREGRALA